MNGRMVVLLALLFVAAPVHAEEAGGSGEPRSGQSGGNQTQEPNATTPASSDMQSSAKEQPCELVRWYGLARPTYIVVDPDRCFVPHQVRELVNRII